MNKTEPNQNTRKYWQSLEEKQDLSLSDWNRAEFAESEKDMREKARAKGTSRRDFLKFMGASAVMATAACRRPAEQIVPAVKRPPEVIPGLPTFYSTTSPSGSGLIIRTRDGRPIQIAGNPDHPLTAGGVTASEVASIMDLYDPDRLRKPVVFETTKSGKRRKKKSTDSEITAAAAEKLAAGGYVLLTGAIDGPSSRAIVQDFLRKYPGGRHVEYRPDPTLRQIAEGQRESYGQDLVPSYRFDRADLIVSIDGDFLGTMVQPAWYSAGYSKNRDVLKNKNKLNRLVVFESMFSLTGSNADDRHGIRPGDQALIALAIASYLIVEQRRSNLAGNGQVTNLLRQYRPENITGALKHETGLYRKGFFEQVIAGVAEELWAHRGKSLVVGGSPLAATGSNAAAQIAINLLNSILDNDGKTVAYGQPLQLAAGQSDRELQAVLGEVGTKYKTVIIAGANPLYHLPTGANAKEALGKAEYVLSLTDRLDESSAVAHAALPVSHFLESWGDSEVVSGVHGIQQPVIRPLYKTLSFEDRLIQLAGGSLGGQSSFHDYVKASWRKLAGGQNFRKFWVSALQAGFYAPGRAALKAARPARNFRAASVAKLPGFAAATSAADSKKLVLGLYYNVQVLDGTGANNAYRQELPEPVTKIVWDNYVAILPATARRLGIKQGAVVDVKTAGGAKLRLPVHLQPGLHPEAACVALGYGRTAVGKTGDDVGQNAVALVETGSDSFAFSGQVVELVKTGDRYLLASTQTIYRKGYNDQDKYNAPFTPKGAHDVPYNGSSQYTATKGDGTRFERPITRETTFAEYKNNNYEMSPPGVVYPEGKGLMEPWEYKGNRWHMIIDQNQCTGCGSCVTACNSENNIPMVGRDQVSKGREMHWMRIDRYFSGEEDQPLVSHQPMLCQHCENAPCENVCPVTATTHNSEGLNVMTYNRCVGTRYCANNCPYKVRRFNWYENWNYMEGLQRALRDPQQLAMNPDVTVRTRGVMEKCTFCIQRIAVARQESRAQGDKFVADGMVKTACQDVCPSNSITFGNINDPKSAVSRLKKKEAKRSYQVLDFLAVKPSITYLGRIRNTGKA
ncbi:MAG: TAT-variant-translocated molybdopterin oxidoreductase [bacterium]|nr:TAT-variant-translocated molybdopterin oxidoreductase [bacterium]